MCKQRAIKNMIQERLKMESARKVLLAYMLTEMIKQYGDISRSKL